MPARLEATRVIANTSARTDHDIKSPVRAYQIVESLKTLWNSKSSQLKFWTRQLAELIENKAWLLIPEGNPYGNPETMMKSEVGCTVDEFIAFMKLIGIDADLLYEVDKALHDKPATPRHKPETIAKAEQAKQLYEELGSQRKVAEKMGVNQATVSRLLKSDALNRDDVTQKRITDDTRGNNSRYAVERLRRAGEDELAKSVLTGETTAKEALQTAGIKVDKAVTVRFQPDEPGSQIASKLYQKLTDDQLKELLESLLNFFSTED